MTSKPWQSVIHLESGRCLGMSLCLRFTQPCLLRGLEPSQCSGRGSQACPQLPQKEEGAEERSSCWHCYDQFCREQRAGMALPQLPSHESLFPLAFLSHCFLQLLYPVYQREADIKAWNFHLLLLGEQVAPTHGTGVPGLRSLLTLVPTLRSLLTWISTLKALLCHHI